MLTSQSIANTTTSTQNNRQLIPQLQHTVEVLTNELAKAHEEIKLLKEQHQQENSRTLLQDPQFDDILLDEDDEDLTQDKMIQTDPSPPKKIHPCQNTQRINQLPQSLYTEQQRKNRIQKRQATAARFFQKPSANQGFHYIYIPTKTRIPIDKLQTTFRRLGIPNGRLLDIHHPTRNLVAILVHNDYVSEFKTTLQQLRVTVDEDFDPFNGKNIKEPRYAHHTELQRDQIASYIHKRRLETALQHIRESVKFAVARYFYQQQWISKSVLDHTIAASSSLPTDVFLMENSQPVTKPRTTFIFEFDENDNLIPPHTSFNDKDENMTDTQ